MTAETPRAAAVRGAARHRGGAALAVEPVPATLAGRAARDARRAGGGAAPALADEYASRARLRARPRRRRLPLPDPSRHGALTSSASPSRASRTRLSSAALETLAIVAYKPAGLPGPGRRDPRRQRRRGGPPARSSAATSAPVGQAPGPGRPCSRHDRRCSWRSSASTPSTSSRRVERPRPRRRGRWSTSRTCYASAPGGAWMR